jgi:hypothetical protein
LPGSPGYDLRVVLRIMAVPALLALGLGAVLAVAVLPSIAWACSCPDRAALSMWPPDGALDVPIDTPLVISRYDLSGSADSIGYALIDADGREVALEETGRLPAAYAGCGASETVFLRPSQPLAAHAQYTLAIAADVDPGHEFGASFTTSDALFQSEPEALATLDYVLVTDPDCDGTHCVRLAEASFGLSDTRVAPLWLELQSAADAHGHNALVLTEPDDDGAVPGQLSVVLPPSDDCIDVRLYGIEGVALFQERRCQPDRCAQTDTLTFNSCGGPPFSGVVATETDPGKCAAAPAEGEPQVAVDPPAQDSGCSSRSPMKGSDGAWYGALLSAWLLTRRRWSARHDHPPPAP